MSNPTHSRTPGGTHTVISGADCYSIGSINGGTIFLDPVTGRGWESHGGGRCSDIGIIIHPQHVPTLPVDGSANQWSGWARRAMRCACGSSR
jgi:hypothetical protein